MDAPVLPPRNLVRTRGGAVIHRSDCQYNRSGRGVPWLWADTVSINDIQHAVDQLGYHVCTVCQPIPEHTVHASVHQRGVR